NDREAVQRPPTEPQFGRVIFEDAATDQLITSLARITVQNLVTGKSEEREGHYVEPLYLQLVCARLWNDRAEPDRITTTDLERLTDGRAELTGVPAALAGYYDAAVTGVAGMPGPVGVSERAIRLWFDRAAISADGLRLPVLLGTEGEHGLAPTTLSAL